MACTTASKASALVCPLLLAVTLAFCSSAVEGVDRARGEFWTYETAVSTEIFGMHADLSGLVTYTEEGRDSMTFGGTVHTVNILGVEGSLSGQVVALDKSMGSAEFSLSGIRYELVDGPGIFEENVTTAGDVILGIGLLSFTYHLQTQVIVTTTPPMLEEFDPVNGGAGVSWSQPVTTVETIITFEDGAIANRTTASSEVIYNATVSATEPIDTPAGAFPTMRVVVSDGGGNCEIFWWSEDVNNFVKHEVHKNGSSVPSLSQVLSEYGKKSSKSELVVVVVGVTVFAFGVAVLVRLGRSVSVALIV